MDLQSIGDPKTLFKYFLIIMTVNIAVVSMFIFTMDKEFRLYFQILLGMLIFFLFIMLFLIPAIFKDNSQTRQVEEEISEKKIKQFLIQNNFLRLKKVQ